MGLLTKELVYSQEESIISPNGQRDPLEQWRTIIETGHQRIRQYALEQGLDYYRLSDDDLYEITVKVVRESHPDLLYYGIPAALGQSMLSTLEDLEDILEARVGTDWIRAGTAVLYSHEEILAELEYDEAVNV